VPKDQQRKTGKDLEKQKTAWSQAVSVSAPEGIRTPNLLIRSQMLYPLSYGRMFGCPAVKATGVPGDRGSRGLCV
jgi:hypothetical protein